MVSLIVMPVSHKILDISSLSLIEFRNECGQVTLRAVIHEDICVGLCLVDTSKPYCVLVIQALKYFDLLLQGLGMQVRLCLIFCMYIHRYYFAC